MTTDTAGVTFICTATSAGGSTTQSVTIKRDATAPQLEFGAPTPAANAAGWHGGDVSVLFTASDATSGTASTSQGSPVLITGAGANLSVDVEVTDNAGNRASYTSPAVNIDRSAPEVAANVTGTVGANGWYTSDVQVAWTTSDDRAPLDSAQGCNASLVAADTAGITFTCTATSAGGATTRSVTIRRDTTPPLVDFGTASPAATASGWNNTDVALPFMTSDAASGVANTSTPSPLSFNGEGAGIPRSVTVTDVAGNSATYSRSVNIDRTHRCSR